MSNTDALPDNKMSESKSISKPILLKSRSKSTSRFSKPKLTPSYVRLNSALNTEITEEEQEVLRENNELAALSNMVYLNKIQYPNCQFDIAQMGTIKPLPPSRKDSIRVRKRAKTTPPGCVRVALGRCFLEPVLSRSKKNYKRVNYSRQYTRPRSESPSLVRPYLSIKQQDPTNNFGEIGYLKNKCGFILPSAEYTVKNMSLVTQPRGRLLSLQKSYQRHREVLEGINTVYPGAHGSTHSLASRYSLHSQHLISRDLLAAPGSQTSISTSQFSTGSTSKVTKKQDVYQGKLNDEDTQDRRRNVENQLKRASFQKEKRRTRTSTANFSQDVAIRREILDMGSIRESLGVGITKENSEGAQLSSPGDSRLSFDVPPHKDVADWFSEKQEKSDESGSQVFKRLPRLGSTSSPGKPQSQMNRQSRKHDSINENIPLYPKYPVIMNQSDPNKPLRLPAIEQNKTSHLTLPLQKGASLTNNRARRAQSEVKNFLRSLESSSEQYSKNIKNRVVLHSAGTSYTKKQIESFYERDGQMLKAVKKRIAIDDKQKASAAARARRDRSLLSVFGTDELPTQRKSISETSKRVRSMVVLNAFHF